MAPRRFAIAVVLICAGVMLLSACGLGAGRYVPPPILASQDVMLVLPGEGSEPQKILGFGVIGGVSMQDLTATLALSEAVCGVRRFDLRGSVAIASPVWVRLRGSASDGSRMEVSATLRRLSSALAADLFPFPATLSLTTRCGGQSVRQVAVERLPDLSGAWVGSVAQEGGRPTVLDVGLLFRNNIYAGSWVTGEVRAQGWACFTHATHAQQGDELGSGPLTLKFKAEDGTALELRSSTSPLLTDVVRNGMEMDLTVRGGKCDGRTFRVLLQRK